MANSHPPSVSPPLPQPSSFITSPHTFLAVNYAAGVALEIRQPSTSGAEPVVRFTFKNGTDDAAFTAHPMQLPTGASGTDLPLSTFVAALNVSGTWTLAEWCNACGQETLRGCSAALALAGETTGGGAGEVVWVRNGPVSPVAAGFIGAGVTIAVWGLGFAVLAFMGYLKFVRPQRKQRGSDTGSSVCALNLVSLW